MSTIPDANDDPWTPEPGDARFQNHHDDGVCTVRHVNRWQKHGKDRIYMSGDNEGYIDLKHGEAVDLEHSERDVEYDMTFCAEDNCLYLWAVCTDENKVKNSLSKKSRKEVARIPRDVMGGGD